MWYNPMTWIAALKNLATVIKAIKSAWSWVVSFITQKKQEKEIKQASDAVQEIEEANKIEDEDARLKAKAEAACKLEKSINPKSDC